MRNWSLWNKKSPIIASVQKVVKKKDLCQWWLNSKGEMWPQRQAVLQMKWRRGASVAQHPLDPGKYSPSKRNARYEDYWSFHVNCQILGTGRIKGEKQRAEHFTSSPSKTEAKHWKRKLHSEKKVVLQHTNNLVAREIRGNNAKSSFL